MLKNDFIHTYGEFEKMRESVYYKAVILFF